MLWLTSEHRQRPELQVPRHSFVLPFLSHSIPPLQSHCASSRSHASSIRTGTSLSSLSLAPTLLVRLFNIQQLIETFKNFMHRIERSTLIESSGLNGRGLWRAREHKLARQAEWREARVCRERLLGDHDAKEV